MNFEIFTGVMEEVGMDYQGLFNIAVGSLGFLFGFLLNNVWSEIKTLQQNERDTTTRIGAIEVLVAGNYVTKAEHTRTMEKVFEKLDEISRDVNKKVDR